MPRSKTVNVKEILQEDDDIQYPDSENIEYDDDDDDVVYEDDEDVNTDEDQDENWEQDENGDEDEDEDVNAGLVKPTGKGKKKPGVMVKSELVEIKTKGKKARIKAEVDANVPVDAENDVQILDGGCSTSNLTTQCRPTALLAVIETFNSNQIKSVSEIGFGWLLSLPTQTSKLDTTLFPWLIDHFDPVSWLFKIEAGKEFIFSPCDVHDVFLLPLHSDNPIVDSSTRTKDVGLKNQWRDYFKVKKNATIPLRLLEIKMGELVEGGEMFKRIFVMFAFSVFLAPIANRTADLGLVKVLEDVDEIKNLDWCGYVHERLCRAIRKHKTSGCQGNVGGCLWVLQVVYFHRLQFRGIAESCSLPLMKHWSGTKIHERLVLEKDSACFGSGLLNTVTYPVCQKLGFEEGFAKICGRHDAVNDDENHIRFVIPDGQLSNSAIQSISIDEMHAEFLRMKRNLEIVSNFHLKQLEAVAALRRRSSPSLPDDDLDPRYYAMMQELAEMVVSVQSMPGGLENIYCDGKPNAIPQDDSPNKKIQGVLDEINVNETANKTAVQCEEPRIVDATTDPAQQTNQGATLEVDVQPSLSEQLVVPLPIVEPLPSVEPLASAETAPKELKVYEPTVGYHSIIHSSLADGKAKIGIPCGKVNTEPFLVGHFMRFYKRNMKRLPELYQEVADYCLLDDPVVVKAEETLVWFDTVHMIQREDMLSLAEDQEIYLSIIECWALMINANEMQHASPPSKFCFGVRQSEILELLWQDSTNEAAMDQLLICWKEWIDIYNNGFDITCVDLVFVPFFRERHFFLFVLNLKTKTMQHVDNLVYDEAQIIDLESFSTTLCDLLGTFLDDRGNNHEGDIGTYPMEEIEFDWKTAKGSDLDCGIYTMISMLTFEGIKCSCPDLKEPRKRIVLRAEICATLVLSDMNDKRAEVLNKLADFNSKRVDVYPHVVTRRKQKLANDRKLKKEAAKKEKEVEKKAEENANENKKPEGKIAQENANENEKPEGNMAEMNNNVADVNDNAAEGNEQPLKTFTSRKRLKRNVADASVPENVGPPEKKQAPTKRTAKKPAA
ncbi:uncharacterized protein [Spinacia oleracea]|uniref:Ubiquitin-like protease family profile domain-containing protein n=1 Tax=Spinacia oleracea TaxID=3562 RepID=A0ABM3RDM2_SPIOL|nr:uncharacterized protein LOC110802827 [Spinacia oleracea]XP_056693694.1 uncharacterized protein LOC110802827 [Spinacia oleracea]